MANTTISALTSLATADDADVLAIDDVSAGETKKIAVADLLVGLGDVAGPASSTDNAVALFDGTTGKLLKDSELLVDTALGVVTVAPIANRNLVVATPDAPLGAGDSATVMTVKAGRAGTNAAGAPGDAGELVVAGGQGAHGTSAHGESGNNASPGGKVDIRGGQGGGNTAAHLAKGGELWLRSGQGGTAFEAEAPAGNIVIAAEFGNFASPAGNESCIYIYTGVAPFSLDPAAIILAANAGSSPIAMAASEVQVSAPLRLYEVAAPAAVGNAGALFVVDDGGNDELRYIDESGNITQLSRTLVKIISTTTYTLLDEDNGFALIFDHASGCTVTVPASWRRGSACTLTAIGGQVQLAEGGTLTLVPPSSAASPPATKETGATIAVLMADDTTSAEIALVSGALA